jgi:hypothetical protein
MPASDAATTGRRGPWIDPSTMHACDAATTDRAGQRKDPSKLHRRLLGVVTSTSLDVVERPSAIALGERGLWVTDEDSGTLTPVTTGRRR